MGLISCATPPNRADAERDAAAVWSQRCANCHGPEGRGDGPAGAAVDPKPRSFHDLEWQSATTDGRIRRAIIYGGASLGLNPAMAPNPDLRDRPAVVDVLVAKVRAFAAPRSDPASTAGLAPAP